VTAFYRRDVKFLLRCTECVFIHNSVLTLFFRIGMGKHFFFLRVLLFSLVTNISPLFHTLLRLHVFLTRRKNGRILGTFQKPLLFSEVGEHLVEKSSGLVFKGSRFGIISPNTAGYAGFICLLTPGFCKHLVTLQQLFCRESVTSSEYLNHLTPNVHFSGRTAPLTYRRCILYIYSTNIRTEYFKHSAHSAFFPLQNVVYFIMLPFLVPVLFTF
jgi:hypothetical protein